MPVIKTKDNRVVADEREDDHTHVRVVWFGPSQDGKHRRVFDGALMPIEDYQAAVDWAVAMADQMVHPLYVVPYDGLQALREPELEGALSNLDDQERGDLRRFVVGQLAEVLRDCEDPDVRAEAYDVLVGLKVVRP